jgi:uncharacterized protein YkwD
MKPPAPWHLRLAPLAALTIALIATPAAGDPARGRTYDNTVFVEHLAQLINHYREDHGLEPLSLAEELIALAGEHSASMAAQRQLSHEGFRDRYRLASSKICVENVGWNHPTPESLLEGWVRSPAHHRNLLEPKVMRMGLAATTRYVTFFACR